MTPLYNNKKVNVTCAHMAYSQVVCDQAHAVEGRDVWTGWSIHTDLGHLKGRQPLDMEYKITIHLSNINVFIHTSSEHSCFLSDLFIEQ